MLKGQNHGSSGNMEQQLHLELWKGNLGNALNICKETGELNEMVVSMSPLGELKLFALTKKYFLVRKERSFEDNRMDNNDISSSQN